jgi:hypothetical protein
LGLDIIDGFGLLEENVDARGSTGPSLLGSTDKLLNAVVGNDNVQLLGIAIVSLKPENVLGTEGDLGRVDADAVEGVDSLTNQGLFAAHLESSARAGRAKAVVLGAAIGNRRTANHQGEELKFNNAFNCYCTAQTKNSASFESGRWKLFKLKRTGFRDFYPTEILFF